MLGGLFLILLLNQSLILDSDIFTTQFKQNMKNIQKKTKGFN